MAPSYWGKQSEKIFMQYNYEYLCVDCFLIGTDVYLISLFFNLIIVRSDQGGSRNLFSTQNVNKTTNVTLVFDDNNFSAHKGTNKRR